MDVTKSDEQRVMEILNDLKGHPDFVIANRIVDELRQRWEHMQPQIIESLSVTIN